MSLSQLITKSCTLHRASGNAAANAYGDEATAYVNVATVCELQQISRTEPDQAEISDAEWRAFFLPTEDMGSKATANKLTVDGEVYQFTGRPWKVRNPRTQQDSHIEATLRITE